jgi:hypothetical protein
VSTYKTHFTYRIDRWDANSDTSLTTSPEPTIWSLPEQHMRPHANAGLVTQSHRALASSRIVARRGRRETWR